MAVEKKKTTQADRAKGYAEAMAEADRMMVKRANDMKKQKTESKKKK